MKKFVMMRWKVKKRHYLCNSKRFKTNRAMKTKGKKSTNILEKMLEDKKAIQKCIREGGDLKQVAKERNVRFVTPL